MWELNRLSEGYEVFDGLGCSWSFLSQTEAEAFCELLNERNFSAKFDPLGADQLFEEFNLQELREPRGFYRFN